MEVIVVDNASADGAPEMVARDFPEVTLIRNSINLGFSAANNQAAMQARGHYLFFLNNDTVIPPGALRGMLSYAEEHPEIGMLGPRLRDGEGQVQVSYRLQPTVTSLLHRTILLRWTGLLRKSYLQYRRAEFDCEKIREVDVLMGAAMFTRRTDFLRWGGWDEDFRFGGEDLELSTRLNHVTKLVYYPEVEITHFGRVSTREHVAFSSPQIAVGIAKYLRKIGTPAASMFAYKLAMTIDTPLTIMAKLTEAAIRRVRGKSRTAKKSLLAAQAAWHFLRRGLMEFWRA